MLRTLGPGRRYVLAVPTTPRLPTRWLWNKAPLFSKSSSRSGFYKGAAGLMFTVGLLGANMKIRPLNTEEDKSDVNPRQLTKELELTSDSATTPELAQKVENADEKTAVSKVAEAMNAAELTAKVKDLIASLPSARDVSALSTKIPSGGEIASEITSIAKNVSDSLPTAADIEKLPQKALSKAEIAEKLEEISVYLRDLADVQKKLPSPSDLAEQSAKLVPAILTPSELRKLAERIPSTEELTAQLQELADRLPSTGDVAAHASKLANEAIHQTFERMLEGTIISQVKAALEDGEWNPEVNWEAKVRTGTDLCKDERDFVRQRSSAAAQAISDFIGERVEPDDVPVIGIAASGGGCRAMIGNLASLEAFDKMGLLDGVTYIAGVSGSTWAMAQLYSLGRDFDAIRQRLAKQLATNYLSLSDLVAAVNSPGGERVLIGIAQKYFAAKSFSTVDIFGTLLTARLLVPEAAKASATRAIAAAAQAGAKAMGNSVDDTDSDQVDRGKLSYQQTTMEKESLPLPIYTAVSHHIGKDTEGSKYQWWEFTPFEAGFRTEEGKGNGAWVPVWSFGRVFESGTSREKLPEQSLGLLLGTFGSAFTATVRHIWNEFNDALPEAIRQRVLPLLEDISEVHPIPPASFPNTVYALPNFKHLTDEKTIGLMDSGMDNNIPFPPLTRPERHVDVIIALDASMDIGADPWLLRAEAYAEKCKLPFPPTPKPTTDASGNRSDPIRSSHCTVLSTIDTHPATTKTGAHDLTIIYLPLITNPKYKPALDPAKEDFCATYNFTYTPEQTDKLSGLARLNVEESADKIRDAVRKAWKEKRRKRLEAENGPREEF